MNHQNDRKMLNKSLNFLIHLTIYMCLSNLMVQAQLAHEHNSLDETLVSAEQNHTSHRQGRCKSVKCHKSKERFIQNKNHESI